MDGSAPHVKSPPCRVGGHRSSRSEDIKYLICHVTLQNHVIEGSCNLMSSSLYVTTLQVSWP